MLTRFSATAIVVFALTLGAATLLSPGRPSGTSLEQFAGFLQGASSEQLERLLPSQAARKSARNARARAKAARQPSAIARFAAFASGVSARLETAAAPFAEPVGDATEAGVRKVTEF